MALAAPLPRVAANPVPVRPFPVRPAAAARARIAASSGYPGEDRSAFALLLLPFLIVAMSLTMAQMRRTSLPSLPDIAARAPAPVVTAARPPAVPAIVAKPETPNSTTPTVETPKIQPPTTTASPTSQPSPPPPASVASVDIHPAVPRFAEPFPPPPALEKPVPLAPAQPFPPPAPVVEVPVVASPSTLSRFPPPPPDITTANLDVRPPPVAPHPAPILPPVATAAPTIPTPPAEQQVCSPTAAQTTSFAQVGRLARAPRQPRLAGVDAETFGKKLSAAALAQTEDLVIYTARYQPMAYPMGDVVALHGACIDVVIRAYRTLGIDLQEEVQRSRPSRGDANIDHRRTENLRRFLERHGTSLPVTNLPEYFKPGDIVTYYRPFSRISTSHIAVVTDVIGPSRRPMIVHNRGYGPQLEDALFVDRITGHYRYMGGPAAEKEAGTSATPMAPVVRASFRSSPTRDMTPAPRPN